MEDALWLHPGYKRCVLLHRPAGEAPVVLSTGMQPGHGQTIEARRDTGISGHVFVQAAALMEERNAQRVK
jgi:hypothetical protein